MQGLALVLVVLTLSACASGSKLSDSVHSIDGQGDTSSNSIDQKSAASLSPVFLSPVSLYAPSVLNLGAQTLDNGELVLLLSDDRQRSVDADKPLLVNIDGRTTPLPFIKRIEQQDVGVWYQFSVTKELLSQLGSSNKAMLRVYFQNGPEEARISGTQSDYLSRPKAYGVQGRLKKFLDELTLVDTDR